MGIGLAYVILQLSNKRGVLPDQYFYNPWKEIRGKEYYIRVHD
jgi:hypothetical protein